MFIFVLKYWCLALDQNLMSLLLFCMNRVVLEADMGH